jgi:transposase
MNTLCGLPERATKVRANDNDSTTDKLVNTWRGYSFEALRAKILFTEGLHKHVLRQPKFERKAQRYSAMMTMKDIYGYGLPPEREEPERNLGVDISTLADRIEQDRL